LRQQQHFVLPPPSPPVFAYALQDKGDIVASAAAARASGPHGPQGNACGTACPSAFQLVGGAEGLPGQGSRAAARAAAMAEQQRWQQLAAAVPRAVDVLGLIGREGGGSGAAAAAAGERCVIVVTCAVMCACIAARATCC
jgi:hypothetical protein